ncbi:MAG TPA: ComEC/Rec2 family competence protein, partial [Flavisolibacter sp.]|nr:ComEC/Rec2 family competence protein [Flavisolibacter sp.]
LLFATIGALLIWLNDIRHDNNWIGHHYNENNVVVVKIEETILEKTNSYKAEGSLVLIKKGNTFQNLTGKVILYFKKDSAIKKLQYGSQIAFNKNLQEIKNAGNPGSFDYKRYSLFEGITHQVYLNSADFILLPDEDQNRFKAFIFNCRKTVVNTLKEFIPGEKEQGLSEALLIGYKDDLDKNLVQAYSNTGVVHIIAISGLHLGLIYWLLLLLTRPLKKKKQLLWLRLTIIISCLWLFSILAGAQPSVLRAAVMFSFLAVGELITRKPSIINSLALSAFLLLCYNPFFLWDVGFQLSYAAVLSIILFFKPIYNWFYIKNKILDFFWKITAVTIAAQLFTLPISIYHFHQMPLLFLFTNFMAVPLSSVILIGEIFLVIISFIAPVAQFTGVILHHLIFFMNSYIERLDNVSFSVWSNLNISVLQTFFLLLTISAFSYWLLEKNRRFFLAGMLMLTAFISLRSYSFIQANRQSKLIIYNVPKHTAIDIVNGRSFYFLGDQELQADDFTRNFHLQPSRIQQRLVEKPSTSIDDKYFEFAGKQMMIIDSTIRISHQENKPTLDVLILSKNPKIYISNLLKSFSINQIVIDGSVPSWKRNLWKKDCDSLKIPCYDVVEKGAFVMNFQ